MNDLPDSGERTAFGDGDGVAVREADDAKPAMEGISPFALDRIGMHYRRGAIKYGDMRNWEAGMPWTRMIGAILRHTVAFMRNDESEDHLAAIAWNAIALMHYETIDVGDDDRPVWPNEISDKYW